MFTRASETILRKTETKEVVNEYDIPAVKEQYDAMVLEVARIKAILDEAEKLGINESVKADK
jgi:predicted adenine nucleotide alpha hydrolase (AANH) superfamily ATPase